MKMAIKWRMTLGHENEVAAPPHKWRASASGRASAHRLWVSHLVAAPSILAPPLMGSGAPPPAVPAMQVTLLQASSFASNEALSAAAGLKPRPARPEPTMRRRHALELRS